MTRESRWDQEARAHELAYTEYVDSLCDCGVPREICWDPERAWLVDHRVGYRCRALETVQRTKADEDKKVEEAGGKTYPSARKWFATEHREGPDHGGQDSHSPVHR